jgi:hypothetical protein
MYTTITNKAEKKAERSGESIASREQNWTDKKEKTGKKSDPKSKKWNRLVIHCENPRF